MRTVSVSFASVPALRRQTTDVQKAVLNELNSKMRTFPCSPSFYFATDECETLQRLHKTYFYTLHTEIRRIVLVEPA